MQASRIIKQFDEVKMVVGKTGSAEVPTDPMPPEATDMIIVLKPQSEWKTKNPMTSWPMRSVKNWKIFQEYF